MSEENVVRDEAPYRDDAPPRSSVESIVEAPEIGNAVGCNAEPAQPFEIFAAGALDQQTLLSFEQQSPARVLLFAIGLPVLLDGKIWPDRSHRPLRNCILSKCECGSGASIGRPAPRRSYSRPTRHFWATRPSRSTSWARS